MVVIQPEEETALQNLSKPRPTASTSKTTTSDTDATKAASIVNGSDSDGFETASERGVSDNEEEDIVSKEINPENSAEDHLQQQHTQNDARLIQRGVEQGNEAKSEGNRLFGNGQYEEALLQYELALQVAPQDVPSSVELRSICHFNRGVCFFKLRKYEDTIKECSKASELNPSYMKALVRRGEAHEKLEHFEEAIADMKKILEFDPSNDQAQKTIRRLEPLAAQKREKMKEEMIGIIDEYCNGRYARKNIKFNVVRQCAYIHRSNFYFHYIEIGLYGKLKEIGNSLLGRFGMNIDNFKAVQDPNTGSYSISFQR